MRGEKRIYQNDLALPLIIRTIGCFFRSALWVVEDKCGLFFTPEDLIIIWDICKERGIINDQNEMEQGAVPVMNIGFKLADSPLKAMEIGIFKMGEFYFYGGEKKDFNYLIQKIEMDDTHKEDYHYRVVNRKGRVLFDPYFPAITPKKILYSVLFQVG